MLKEFEPNDTAHIASLVAIWNSACGHDLAITPRLVDYNTRPPTGAAQAGQIAVENSKPIGFVLASALPNDPQTSPPQTGWIDAIAAILTGQARSHGKLPIDLPGLYKIGDGL